MPCERLLTSSETFLIALSSASFEIGPQGPSPGTPVFCNVASPRISVPEDSGFGSATAGGFTGAAGSFGGQSVHRNVCSYTVPCGEVSIRSKNRLEKPRSTQSDLAL